MSNFAAGPAHTPTHPIRTLIHRARTFTNPVRIPHLPDDTFSHRGRTFILRVRVLPARARVFLPSRRHVHSSRPRVDRPRPRLPTKCRHV